MEDVAIQSNTKAQEIDPVVDFVAGTVAGAAGLIVGFPFDTVKVRFQSPQIAGRYRSTAHAFATIIKEERIFGLYKGVTSPLATCALMNGLVFASYRVFMKAQLDHPNAQPTLAQIALAGAGSGIVSSIITTPTELIKIRQQASLTPTSATRVALQIFKESGTRGLYRGITSTALRDCGYGAYFAAYEATCRYFTTPATLQASPDHSSIFAEVESDMNKLPWYAMLIAGGVAGVAGWLFTFPMDVVKTRMQGSQHHLPFEPSANTHLIPTASTHSNGSNPYRTTISTIVNSYRTEGIGVFFRGLAPTLIRAIPVNMATFAVFEVIVHALS
ncbi:hypothetical protein PC9H_006831 [Pleurotus ostreatus]|uniref:Mitochondrial carrier n=1 Tax=Pleurotus ostreatus TaxID=5322 RepID=A0A8H7A1M8_PLEOS|nr:uncharacterized protein PC9H_006831 [Pleurotus ostreatus]KAF7431111.1 hypothetical protein PC9H_006831 [Pleurotus ostreatus]